MKLFLVVSLMLLLGAARSVFGEDPSVLRLQSGDNEIPIVIHNETLQSINQLTITVNTDTPSWLSVLSDKIELTPDNSQDRHVTKFNLSLLVNDTAEHPDTILPLVLTDNIGRTWKILLHVQALKANQERSVLFGNFPNPFNPSTIIRYKLGHFGAKSTTLVIYNMIGQHIRTLVNEPQFSGSYQVQWDARDDQGRAAASGVYIYYLKSGSFKQTRSMTLIH